MHSRATDRSSAFRCQGKWPDQTLDLAFGLPEVLVAVSTSRLSCRRAGKTRTLMPVWDSSGESQFKEAKVVGSTSAPAAREALQRARPQGFNLSNPLCTAACGVAEAAAVAACSALSGGVAIAVCVAAAHEAGNYCRSRC